VVFVGRFRQSSEASSAQATYEAEEDKIENDSDSGYGGNGGGKAQQSTLEDTQKRRLSILAVVALPLSLISLASALTMS